MYYLHGPHYVGLVFLILWALRSLGRAIRLSSSYRHRRRRGPTLAQTLIAGEDLHAGPVYVGKDGKAYNVHPKPHPLGAQPWATAPAKPKLPPSRWVVIRGRLVRADVDAQLAQILRKTTREGEGN